MNEFRLTSRLIELFGVIFDNISNNSSLKELEKGLSKDTRFEKELVATAYSWLFDRAGSKSIRTTTQKGTKNFRVFSKDEQLVLGSKNIRWLTGLLHKGLITAEEVEIVIDQLRYSPFEAVGEQEFILVIMSLLFEREQMTTPGHRTLLSASDRIN